MSGLNPDLYCVGCRHWHPLNTPCIKSPTRQEEVVPVSGLFWCHTHNMPWECCECTEIDLNMHSKGVFNHMPNKEDKPRIENDFFVVLNKVSFSQWPDNVYHETDLQTAKFFDSYEGALAEARERAIRKNVTAHVYRVHPVCKLAPQEPKVEEYK